MIGSWNCLFKKSSTALLIGFLLSLIGPSTKIFGQINPYKQVIQQELQFAKDLNQGVEDGVEWNGFSKPWLQRLELRTESNEFKLRQEEYLFRITFNNFLALKYPNQLQSIKKRQLQFEIREFQSNQLFQLYKQIHKLYELDTTIKILKIRIGLLEKLKSVIALQISERPESVEDYVQTEIELSEADFKLVDLENQFKELNQRYNISASTEALLPKLPDLENLYYYVEQEIIPQNPDSIKLYFQMQKEELEYNQKKVESNQVLEYIQSRYNANPEELFAEKFSVGIGIRIPYVISNKYLNSFYKLNVLQSDIKVQQQQKEWRLELSSLKSNMQTIATSNLRIFALTDSLYAKYPDASSKSRLLTIDPSVALKADLKKQTLKNYQIKQYFEFLDKYLQYLHVSGQLIIAPELYYLEWPISRI